MKTLLAATAALALLTATGAFAQPERHEEGGRGEAPRGEAPRGEAPHGEAPHGEVRGGPPPGGGYHPQAALAQPQGAPQYGGQHYGGGYQPQGHAYAGGPSYQGHASVAVRPGWGAPGYARGGGAPRYDGRYYPRIVTLGARFHWLGGGWYPQRGYYYHRWVYGEFLPFGWFGNSYWVSDYWDYGLPVPPYGYNWVRVGPDVLLVRLGDGFVAESVYGVFY